MITTRLLEKLQEKIWHAANKQAPSRKKKKHVCCSDLMNEKQITKRQDGSEKEAEREATDKRGKASLHSWCIAQPVVVLSAQSGQLSTDLCKGMTV